MSDDPNAPGAAPERSPDPTMPRTFLVLVDDTEELRMALRYACLRTRTTAGRMVLLRVVEPPDFQHFGFIGDKMQSEALGDAEKRLQRLAAEVQKDSGRMPMVMVRQGKTTDEIVAIVQEDPSISVLVLAAGKGKDGPGPLVKGLAGSFGARLKVPVLVVPPHLTDEDLQRLTT